jgi:hypothetical protein
MYVDFLNKNVGNKSGLMLPPGAINYKLIFPKNSLPA